MAAAAVIYDPLVLEHETGRHPENRGRLTATIELLQRRGLWDRLPRLPAAPAPAASLEAVHSPGYLAMLREVAAAGGGHLTADTPLGPRSFEAARAASGAAIRAVDAVVDGEADAAFALVRPPGHHAGPDYGMGFCLVNHAAVAARHLILARGLRRVLLVDYDVHHGNGTQEIFYEDPSVLYFSMHQYPAYPGTGAAAEVGGGEGIGTTVNVPLPAGVGDAGHLLALEQLLAPIAREYRPELILLSAGYDSHWRNAAYLHSIRMNVTVSGFARWVEVLRGLAAEVCGGRLAFVLEGGYDPEALAWSVDATLRVLLGEPVEDPVGPPPQPGEPEIDDLIAGFRRIHDLC